MQTNIGHSSLLFAFRLLVAITLLLLIVKMVDFRQMAVSLASVRPQPVIGSLLIMLLNYCLKTYRWALLLWIRRPDVPFGRLARFNFVSIFLGSLLPSSVSADIVRIYYVSRRVADPRAAISSLFADRIIGTFALSFATLVAFLVLMNTRLFPIGLVLSYSIIAVLVLTLALPLVLRNGNVLEGVMQLLEYFVGQKLYAGLQDIGDHLRSYRSAGVVLTKVLAIAFLNLFIVVLEFYLIAKAFSSQVPIGYFFLFVPLVIFLATLPISIGGVGLVEGGVVFFFSTGGMPMEVCFATALVYRALQLACLLPGTALYLLDDFSVREVSGLASDFAPRHPTARAGKH